MEEGYFSTKAVHFPKSYDEYIAEKVDFFGIETHIHNWLYEPAPYDILVIKSDTMFERKNAEVLVRFVFDGYEVDEDMIEESIVSLESRKRPRITKLHPDDHISPMYKDLRELIKSLPEVFLRTRNIS